MVVVCKAILVFRLSLSQAEQFDRMVHILLKRNFSQFFKNSIFRPFLKIYGFFLDFGYLDIGLYVCIKKLESITPREWIYCRDRVNRAEFRLTPLIPCVGQH